MMAPMKLSILLVLCSFVVMFIAYYVRKQRLWHIRLMGSVMLFDLIFPVYLYAAHDWKYRLIDQEELFSFLIWAHLFLILTLYSLYVFQVQEGKQVIAKREGARQNHRVQSRGIFVIRALVFITGALLIAPEAVPVH